MGNMTTKTWKSAERAIARLLGGQRVPVTGRTRGTAPDVAHPDLSIEVKHWQSLPNWLHDAMDQAEKSNDGTKLSTVILHETGMKYEDSYTVIRLSQLIQLLSRIDELEEKWYDTQLYLKCQEELNDSTRS